MQQFERVGLCQSSIMRSRDMGLRGDSSIAAHVPRSLPPREPGLDTLESYLQRLIYGQTEYGILSSIFFLRKNRNTGYFKSFMGSLTSFHSIDLIVSSTASVMQ